MTKSSVNRYGDECEDDCDCILYELLLYSEWKQEPEVTKPVKPADTTTLAQQHGSFLNIYNYLRKPSPTDDVLRFLHSHLPWKFAVGEDGKVVAILQDTLLEIRASRDEYSSVVGKAVVCRDPVPQWRKMLWSPDCSMLAVAYSSGDVAFYNLLGSNMFCIKPAFVEKEKGIHPLSNILFLKPRVKSKKWAFEFIVVDYKGNLGNYLVSPTDGFEANHTFSFASHYCNGVTAVSYHPSHNLLFVAGITGIQLYDGLTDRGSSVGLSGWRLLNDHPYYQLTLSNEEEEAIWNAQRSFWSWVPVVKKKAEHSTIFRMQVSPKGKLLVCLHSNGAISVWHLPGMRLFRFWNLHDQPDFNARNPQLSYMADRKRYRLNSKFPDTDFYPVDANWWSEKAVIIARHSGAVSVCAVRSLNNLLGESPEFLAGPPQVSALCNDRGFLGLECEMILTSKKLRDDDDDGSGCMDTESSDEEEENSFLSKSSYILRSGVYMVTDIERFQPRRKKPKLLYRTYRLLGLKSTTPEELYARKIDNEEYGEALALAKAYNLDCDLVYQRQWRNSAVSIATIHDYLSKITKRSWVLRECIERVPETFAAARELLEFGLKGINLETVVAVGEGIDGGHFILQHPDLDYDDELDATKSEERNKHLLLKVNPHQLNNDQKELLKFRILLLHYLDMLRTYEIIMGGPHLADSLYDSSFYQRFRSTPLIVSVVEFAREGNCEAVQHMFTYHGSVVLPHWLPILSSFPETLDPMNYQGILPECGVEGGVVLIEQAQLRKKECFEDIEFRLALDIIQDDGSTFLYEEEPDLKQFQCSIENLEPELITKWYRFQVYQVESRSGIVDHALNLLNLGKERNVVGLDDLFHDLKTLDSLVYEVNLVGANLSNLKRLSEFEKVKLLMSKTSEGTFVNDIKQLLLPFLDRCEKQSEGMKMKLLGEYLVDVSSNNLKLPHKLFEYLLMEPNSIITADIEEIINLGFTCIYASPDPDQLDIAEGIATFISKQPMGSLNDLFPKIRDKLHELQRQLTAAKILRNNGIPKAVSYIRDIANNPTVVKQLLSRLARSLVKRMSAPSKSEWEQMLNDILTLQEKVFRCIPTKECYEIYAETLLSSGDKRNIAEASTILDCQKSTVVPKMVSFDRSVKLVLQVAREYFDSSGDLLCPAMDLAKACLQLIVDETEEIQEQLDLIASLQILNDFKLSVLPLQVRQCEDRMQLIQSILYKDPYAYQRWEELLLLAHKLRVCGRNRHECEGRVLAITAKTAYEAEDFKCCAEICKNIVDNNHGIGWQVVQQLGQCREFNDVQQRCDFLSFAVLHCEPDMLDKLLTTRCLLEAQVLHKQLSSHITEESVDLTSGDEEEFSDALTSPMTPKREFPPVLSLMNVVEGSTEVIRKTTYQLLRNVGNKNFWKDALSNWVQIGNYNVSSAIDDDQGEPLSLQAVPQFYMSMFPECRAGIFDPQYDDFFLPDVAAINPALELCRTLLRITLLEGAAGEGPSKMDTTAVLLQLAKHLLPEDTTLGLAHLLLVPDINRVKDCLDSLPATAIAIQIACYYCALTGYAAVYGCQSEKMAIGDMFLYSPSELISHMVSLVENSQAQGAWTEHLIQSQKTMSDFLQGQRLNEFGCGIDLKRFAVDKQYQQDSILGLPMTVDTKRFQLAVTLGSKHGISVSQIAAIHACALLLNTEEITVTEQIKRLNDPQLLELLRRDPDGVCERFQNYVYPSIGGTQHNMLVLYYTVLSSVAENNVFYSLLPKDHVKLLKKIKATSPAIDYKLLVETPNKFLDAVRPAMRKENIGLILKLLKSLPVSMNCTVQPGAVYGAWAATEFFQVSSSAYALGPRLWLDQFRTCSHYFTKMGGADVVNFAKAVCFSEKSIDVMTVDCRLSLLHLVKEYTDGKKKENHGKEWAEASSSIDCWISHLNQINSYHLEEINGNSSPELQLLLRQLDLSRGEPDRIKQVFKFSICSSVPLKTLEGMMKVFPRPSPSVESMLEDQLNESISGLRNGPAPESLALLPHILHRLQEVADDRGCSLSDPWATLELLCFDETLPPKLRLQSVNFLEKNIMPSGTRSKSLLLSRIRAVVDLAWSENKLLVYDSDLDTEAAEMSLFHKLLATAESWQQLRLLKNVLDHWPTFQDSATSENKTSDPWVLLLYKILHFKGEHLDSVLDVVEEICKGKKFSEMSLQHLISQSQETVDLSLVLTLCLCSEHPSLHDAALFILRQKAEMGEVVIHTRVMTLLLRRGLAPDLVGTPIYQQLEQHLLAASDKQLPPIFAVVAQLEDAGHITEARMLSHRAAQLAGHQRGGSLLSGAVKLARRTWSQKK